MTADTSISVRHCLRHLILSFSGSIAYAASMVRGVVRACLPRVKVSVFGIANTDNLETPCPAVVMRISGTYLISVGRIGRMFGSRQLRIQPLSTHVLSLKMLVPCAGKTAGVGVFPRILAAALSKKLPILGSFHAPNQLYGVL
jgi:hypothetical protein